MVSGGYLPHPRGRGYIFCRWRLPSRGKPLVSRVAIRTPVAAAANLPLAPPSRGKPLVSRGCHPHPRGRGCKFCRWRLPSRGKPLVSRGCRPHPRGRGCKFCRWRLPSLRGADGVGVSPSAPPLPRLLILPLAPPLPGEADGVGGLPSAPPLPRLLILPLAPPLLGEADGVGVSSSAPRCPGS